MEAIQEKQVIVWLHRSNGASSRLTVKEGFPGRSQYKDKYGIIYAFKSVTKATYSDHYHYWEVCPDNAVPIDVWVKG